MSDSKLPKTYDPQAVEAPGMTGGNKAARLPVTLRRRRRPIPS